MKKQFLSFGLASIMLLGTVACKNATDNEISPANAQAEVDKTLSIAVIVNTLNSEYWNFVAAGARNYEIEHPSVQVEVMGPPSQTAYDEQMNMIETVLNSKSYDGLVVSALQAETVAHMLEENCDIPVIAMNTPLTSECVLSFVGTGNEAAAHEGGVASAEAAKKAGWENPTAIIIAGTQGDPAGEERLNGFINGATSAGIQVLEDQTQYTDWAADRAVSAMEAIIQNHPNGVSAILCCADDMAIAAARTAKDYPAYDNTVFCGFDGNLNACQAILDGALTLSVAQDPYGMGYYSVDACIRAIQGDDLPTFIDTGCTIIDAENAKQQITTLNSYLK